jgi:superfamily II RNA helicase
MDWMHVDSWRELIDSWAQDEGDLVRILKQAADILKQISICPGSSLSLRDNAKQAHAGMFRTPISD